MCKKVMVGMSGGVDSSVAAKLLQEQGYDVTGVTLKLFADEDIVACDKETRTCCALTDVEDARSVAFKLGFDHFVFNFKEPFREKVMKPFVDTYLRGQTPNPCIECNRHIKFDAMLRRAEELGYEYIATGHYAKVRRDEKSGRYLMVRPADRSKDQTYVLYTFTQHQLAHTLFPLGHLDKTQVRALAEASGLINSRKPDSQDICFVPGGDYASYITNSIKSEPLPGNFIDTQGRVIGEHKGLIHYTIGQRKGLGMTFNKPMFVIRKSISDNTVILGDEADLYTRTLTAENVNFISVERLDAPMRITAKARYSQKEEAALLEPGENGNVNVTFDTPQRALTPGQAVVFYDGDIVVGGGTIV